MNKPPYLTKIVKPNWLSHNLTRIYKYFDDAVRYYDLYPISNQHVEAFDFMLDSGNSIHFQYGHMLNQLFLNTKVVGVYKNMMFPGSVDPVIGITIYGYNKDLTIALEVIKFLLNGYDGYKVVGKNAILYSRKRYIRDTNHKRKHSGKKVHDKILLNLKEMTEAVTCPKPRLLKENVKHREELAKLVYLVEKLDLRSYHGQQKMSYNSAIAMQINRRIQLNRLV